MDIRISAAAAFLLAWSIGAGAAAPVEVGSPDGRVRFELGQGVHLTYTVRIGDRPVIEHSPLGIVVDGVDLGSGAELGKVEPYEANETYPTRGVHSRAVNHHRGARVTARHAKSGAQLTIDVRAFDDGVAFLLIVAADRTRVPRR